MWRNERTAFLLIHGAGAHRPFETLDKFVRGFQKVLEERGDELYDWQHKLQRHENWIQHYISLMPRGKDKQGKSEHIDNESRNNMLKKTMIDFYEYYWDCHMVQVKINVDDVMNWLEKASERARRFYKWYPPQKKEREEPKRLFNKDGDFKSGGYIILIGRVFWWLWRIRLAGPWLAEIPYFGKVARLVVEPINWIIKLVAEKMAGMLRDADIYTCSNVRSWKYEIRKKVLDGAVEELQQLLKDDDYDQIIIVGHSLGSVIAYDALNRIILQMNVEGNGKIEKDKAQKIKGLVTFGSPLDKVAFFFRDIPEYRDDGVDKYPEEYIRYQVLAHHHSFKSITHKWEKGLPIKINPCNEQKLDETTWLNFYHTKDLFAGRLDAYKDVVNIKCTKQVKGLWGLKQLKHPEAHEVYWVDSAMYDRIASEFLKF